MEFVNVLHKLVSGLSVVAVVIVAKLIPDVFDCNVNAEFCSEGDRLGDILD